MPIRKKSFSDIDVENDSLRDIYDAVDVIAHVGVGHLDGGHSGRYPWGSGENSFQRPKDFYGFVKNLENKGVTQVDIAKSLGMSTTALKKYYTIALNNVRKEKVNRARELAALDYDETTGQKMTNVRIGEILGEEYNEDKSPIGESTIRLYLDTRKDAKNNAANHTAELLMKAVDEKGMIDVGTMVDRELGISKEKMNAAIAIAQEHGYELIYGSVPQVLNPNQRIKLRVLAKPGTPNSEIYLSDHVKQIHDYETDDHGKSFRPAFEYPVAIDPNRVMIRYAEEGGLQKDGCIEIREGVKDLSLGGSRYAQVRILVDNGGGTNDVYLKGMAVYNDGSNMPDGVDIIFNTNKPLGTPKTKVLKSVKDNLDKDPSNPFGANIKSPGGQSYYDDPNGKYIDPITGRRQSLSAINKRADAGDWSDWSKEIPSQFLAKQPKALVAKQLAKTLVAARKEYDEIAKVNNPTVKAKLLDDLAGDFDTKARDLKATPFDGQAYHVMIPITSLKNNEVFAPNYPNGSQIALVRFPHAGTFEIPILTVNNNNKEALEVIGADARDAIGINAFNASILSGADFDGDTVLTIPTNNGKVKIQNSEPLEGLKGFDTGLYGPDFEGGEKTDSEGNKHYFRNGIEFKHMTEKYKQIQMGVVSNLITDMTAAGANPDELARAVRHSMVVIDAVKHHLDYRESAEENRISELHKRYQRSERGGATTLMSRAKSPTEINKRADGAFILNQEGNPDNGNVLEFFNPDKRLYKDTKTGKIYTDKDKRTVNVNPETGEKLFHDTKEGYVKINFTDNNGVNLVAPAYILQDNGKYRRAKYVIDPADKDTLDKLYFKDTNDVAVKYDPSKHTLANIPVTEKVAKMDLVKDAREISSGTIKEEYYAELANQFKDMANLARKESMYFDSNPIPYSPLAKAKYRDEYDSLEEKVRLAELNAPKERAANLTAAAIVKAKIEAADEELSEDDIKKLRQNEMVKARAKYGAKNARFLITDKEWEAVQSGAFTKNRLQQILRYADQDCVRKLATPRNELKLSDADIRRIKELSENGETNSAIAARLHIGLSTVFKYLGKEN